jgi:uncharacterized protein with PIN domain
MEEDREARALARAAACFVVPRERTVGVPCAGCGRDYDVTLFAFGRTIHCTCGRRVGLEPRVRKGIAGGELRFIADAMLGRLARWLRILGFDTAYEAHISDGELVRRAIEEQRVVLTRDRTLPEEWRVSGIFVMATDEPLEQLGEVARAFGLERHVRIFTRCNRCNAMLVAATGGRCGSAFPLGSCARRSSSFAAPAASASTGAAPTPDACVGSLSRC